MLDEKGHETWTMPSSETTPLIQKVDVRPRRHRYPHQWLRRFCSVFLSGLCVVVFVFFLYLLTFSSTDDDGDTYSSFSFLRPWRALGLPSASSEPAVESNGISYNHLEKIILNVPDREKIRESSFYYASGPHLAGKNLSQAEWTRDLWREYGIDAEVVAYDVYINYPKSHRLALLETKNGTTNVTYEASLEEQVLSEDPTTCLDDRVPTFHGYSANGNVTAQYVFVNYGTFQDYEDLLKANVSLKGKIALAKYGHNFRGLKVKRAQELGMVGCVMYSDPGDDGDVTIENGYEPYPYGPARNPSSVQRGSVQFLSSLPGDPTTPGYPSKPGVPRQKTDHAIPSIPSIPISYEDALPLLRALNGHGPNATSLNKWWDGGGLKYRGVNYNIGPSPENVTLNLVNEQEYTITPIWDVIGTLHGASEDTVVIGNHRDAWIAGGASDPNSGSACLNEVVRSFGEALRQGWQPMRTIVIGSWDGEEYGLLGSTEWVEDKLEWLGKSAVAYLNVDSLGTGPVFSASAAPLLQMVIRSATKHVQSPNQTIPGQTLHDLWDGRIGVMGSGSDFTAFQDKAGVPSLQYSFKAESESPIYHYHSNYDSFHWMAEFGDPGFYYHEALAKLWGVSTIMLSEAPIIQFSALDYADSLNEYVGKVEDAIHALSSNGTSPPSSSSSAITPKSNETAHYSLKEIRAALGEFHEKAEALDFQAAKLSAAFEVGKDIPYFRWWRRPRSYRLVRMLNARYKALERKFLFKGGLDNRPWFEHTVFAPGRWTGYSGQTLPGLIESIEDGNATNFKRWAGIISDQIFEAARLMHLPPI